MRIERVFAEGGADGVARAVAAARADGFVGAEDDRRLPRRPGPDGAATSATGCWRRWRRTRAATRCRSRSTPASATPTCRCRSRDPGLLKPLIERFDTTPFVLLHCYPFVREAGWLAHVYPNVYFDLSLTIPHVSRPAAALGEALELAPVSKLLYASDAARTPELYLLAATWWRDALAARAAGAARGPRGRRDRPRG